MKAIPLKGGVEFDCLTSWGKKYIQSPSKTKKYAKKKYNRRFRREAKKEMIIDSRT